MAQVITSPMPHVDVDGVFDKPAIFLGGSIEQGLAENWQIGAINAHQSKDIIFINPRRRNWDANAPENVVLGQIQWELEGITKSHAVLINLLPHTISAISLLEFGLMCGRFFAGDTKKIVVVCPDTYWRATNVEETAKFFGVSRFDNLAEGMAEVIELAEINFSVQAQTKVVE